MTQTVSCGPELGVAYLLTKCTKNFRQILNVALAPVLSHTFPALQSIKASALFGALPPLSSSQSGSHEENALPPSKLLRAAHWIAGPFDKYGFGYYLASKVTRVASIGGVTLLLKCGVDVSTVMTYIGIGDTVQGAAGAMGLASLLNVVILPVHLAAMSYGLPVINRHGRRAKDGILNLLRKKES